MPTRSDALSFVLDHETSEEQLRQACRILGLDDEGDVDEVRRRLRERIESLAVDSDVVCLNPGLMDSTLHG